jgi:hypothetical protein
MTQSEGIPQELDDVGFGLDVLKTLPVIESLRNDDAREERSAAISTSTTGRTSTQQCSSCS